jgi:hypothetical protein
MYFCECLKSFNLKIRYSCLLSEKGSNNAQINLIFSYPLFHTGMSSKNVDS